MNYAELGKDNLRSHFVFSRVMPPSDFVLDSTRSSFSQTKKNWPEKTFTTSLNTTNPNTYVKFIFLRTSPLIHKIIEFPWKRAYPVK